MLQEKHKSGFDSTCVSCTRWGNNPHIIHGYDEIEEKFPDASGLFFLLEKYRFEGHWRLCGTCYRAFKEKRVPRLNMKTIEDYINVGPIPYNLPKLNTLEAYLIKLRIPFLRLANMPRSPNLKVFGSMVCVSADIETSLQKIGNRLCLQHSNLIPVNFKRKLSFQGSYLSKVIDASKVFTWLDYLKRNNHLYKDLVVDKEQIFREIKAYENQLLNEAAIFDDKNNENSEDQDVIYYSDTEDSSDDEITNEEGDDLKNIKGYVKEDPSVPQDTLLIDVRQADIDENSLTNQIADRIIDQEKKIFHSDEEYEDNEDEESSTEKETSDLDLSMIDGTKKEEIYKASKKTNKKNTDKVHKRKNKEKVLNVAPGENGKIDNTTKYVEAECFPELFPKGTGTYLSYIESKYKCQ